MDTNTRWESLKMAFDDALDLPESERRSFLARLRIDQKTVHDQLQELLYSESLAGDFLEHPISIDRERTLVGNTIGKYKLIEEIGRGGMGTVFKAVREDGEFEQHAAVKVTNQSWITSDAERRFRIERQVLARLEHPNIVRLLDGGVTANMTPYYVMELVEGVSITTHCKQLRLDLDSRIDLFLQMCSAVSFAHSRLVVHRDLKPANILVTGDGRVKLLDFGIAKILDAEKGQTQTMGSPITPDYASPEQMRDESVSTSTDVYTLGIILYELLTERSPTDIYGVARTDLFRGICDIDPPRPSSRLDANSNTLGFDRHSIKGDLDNIILKCIAKEPERRYASVEQLSLDIKNHLDGYPVSAHPSSFLYVATKFVHRNRGLVGFIAVAAILLIALASAALWQAGVAEQERRSAEKNFRHVRQIANSLILDYHDAIERLPGSIKLREKLVSDALNYLEEVSSTDSSDPELLKEMGIAYRKIANVQGMVYAANLGSIDEAIDNSAKGVSLLAKAGNINPMDISICDEFVKSLSDFAQIAQRKLGNTDRFNRMAVQINDMLLIAEPENTDRHIHALKLRMLFIGSEVLENMTEVDLSTRKADEYKMIVRDAQDILFGDPDNAAILSLLQVSTERIGNLYRWAGGYLRQTRNDIEKVNAFYQQSEEFMRRSLDYAERRVRLEPDNANNKRRLFVPNLNLSFVLTFLGQLDSAQAHQTVAVELLQEIRRTDPHNAQGILDELSIIKGRIEMEAMRNRSDKIPAIADLGLKLIADYDRVTSDWSEVNAWRGYLYNQKLVAMERLNGDSKTIASIKRMLEKLEDDYRKIFPNSKFLDWSGIALG